MEKLRYQFDGELTPPEIVKIIDNFKENIAPQEITKSEYAKGNNLAIMERVIPSTSPQNKIIVSYARRMINLITGYMYKTGLITYASENQKYLDALNEVFEANDEELETEQVGRQVSVHGVGYEMIYLQGADPEETLIDELPGYKKLVPHFVKLPVESTIPIYDYEIVPNLQAFIYFYTVGDYEYIHVYYKDAATIYRRKGESANIEQIAAPINHGIGAVPLVVYENNEDLIGDFQCVLTEIDAYDVLLSDSMNEFDRFAWAYLIMKGFSVSEDEMEKIKHRRSFMGLDGEDAVSFLTKDINADFIKFMAEWIRAEIHRQSGIPNLDDYTWGGSASGETLDKFIYLMELFTDPKESYFKQGLKRRIKLITNAIGLDGDPAEIDIIMNRNSPDASNEQADLFVKYAGRISEQTLIENFADFVPDAEAEMERLAEEKKKNIELYGAGLNDAGPDEESDGEGEGDSEDSDADRKAAEE